MNALWWTLVILLMLIGLVGTVVPLLPGSTIILCAALLHHFTLGGAHHLGWGSLSVLIVLTMMSYALELLSGTLGAKYFGATRWGALGGIVGAIVGLFFGLVGVFVGPLLGVLTGELLAGKGLLPAGKSTWGTVVGTTAGMIGNLAIGILMVGWFLLSVFVW